MPIASLIRVALTLFALLSLFTPTSALAWGYQGHEVVGSIADQLLNANARQHVKDIMNLRDQTAAADLGPMGRLREERRLRCRRL